MIEVGLIDVKRENGRKREVNDYLWYAAAAPFCAILPAIFRNSLTRPSIPSRRQLKAEKVQQKLDRLEDAKLLRLRERRERQEKSDSVQLLLSGEADAKLPKHLTFIGGLGAGLFSVTTAYRRGRPKAYLA